MTNRYCPLCKREMVAAYGSTYKDLICERDDHFYSERIMMNSVVSITKIRVSNDGENFYIKRNYENNTTEVWKTKPPCHHDSMRVILSDIIMFRSYEPEKILNKIKTLLTVS